MLLSKRSDYCGVAYMQYVCVGQKGSKYETTLKLTCKCTFAYVVDFAKIDQSFFLWNELCLIHGKIYFAIQKGLRISCFNLNLYALINIYQYGILFCVLLSLALNIFNIFFLISVLFLVSNQSTYNYYQQLFTRARENV